MGIRTKPRVMRDLCSSGNQKSIFSPISERIDLRKKTLRIPLSKFIYFSIIAGIFSYLIFVSALAPVGQNQLSLAAQNEEREQLEKQLQELESQIGEYQTTIDKYKSQGKDLQSEINRLNAQISKLNLQIKSINISLQKLDKEIVVNKNKIVDTENRVAQNKDILARALQNINENESVSIAEILLRRPQLSDFFADMADLMNVQESMQATLKKVIQLREDLMVEKEALAIKKNDAAQLKAYQDSQKQALGQTKTEKLDVLKVTKGEEEKYQAILKEKQKTAAQIRSRIFELLGGGELTFEQAYQFAKFAENATGIRAALVMAVLDRESALGQNVGRCTYQKAMHPTRDIPVFLALLLELSISPDSVTVSCANRDGMYGGAMGPAQFIPSTWNLYKDKIAGITGSQPPSPWRNVDAFVATSLYLKDSIAGCDDIYSNKLSQERCAAAKYYAGGRWRNYLWTYGDRVVTQAEKFQKDIDILNS